MTRRTSRAPAPNPTSSSGSLPASEDTSSPTKETFLSKLYDHLATAPTPPADRGPRVRAASAPAAYIPSSAAISSKVPTPPASAIRWSDAGDAIVVHSVEDLKKYTLWPLYGHQNIETFIRQMAIYGHSRSRPVPGELHFRHPEFRRDTPRTDILNVIRKATSKPSRSISRSSAKSSTLTAKASSSKKKRSTYNARRVVSDSPSSSPLTPRPSRGIVKRNPKPRGLGAAPALVLPPLVIKAEKTVLSRRSSPRNPVTPAPVQPTHKLPPSSDADDERDEHDCDDKLETDVAAGSAALATRQAIEIDLSEAQTSSRTEQISKRATAPSPAPPRVLRSIDKPTLIPFPRKSPVKSTDTMIETPLTTTSPDVVVNQQAEQTSDVDMADTSSVSSLDTPLVTPAVSPMLVPRHSVRTAETDTQLVLMPLNVALSRTLDSFAFPSGYPAAALYPARPRPASSVRGVDTTDVDARARIHRRPSLPSLVALGLMGRPPPSPSPIAAMRRTRSQSVLASSASRIVSPTLPLAAATALVPSATIEAGSLSRPWSPAFGQWQAPPLSPWSSTASESSLRTPLDAETALLVILESPPTPTARLPCASALIGLESNVLGIHLGGGPVPQRSTVTHSHLLSSTHFTLAPAPRGLRRYAVLPTRTHTGHPLFA